jgi:uncharacterized BrkB/YihY/UPF0761 family membrane protein
MKAKTGLMRGVWGLVKDSVNGWINDRAPRKGAALAFYTVFSLAPVLIITIAVAGFFLGEEAARGEIVAQIQGLMGRAAAEAIESIITNSRLIRTINFVLSFGIVTALFSTIYKVMPSVSIAWRDVIVGALITAGLFTIAKFLLGFYLGSSAVTSTYGAAGSYILVLFWVYYSAQIFFLGAEFTKFYAYRYGSRAGRVEGARVLETSRPSSEVSRD